MRRIREKRSGVARGAVVGVVVAGAVIGPAGGLGQGARAQDAGAPPAPTAAPTVTASAAPAVPAVPAAPACPIQGTAPGPKGTAIYDAPSGGRVIATFSGAIVPMRIREMPADPAAGRAAIATSTGSGALRIEGWASASVFPVYTARDLPVNPPYLWMASAQKVKLVKASGGSLEVELALLGSEGQSVRAQAPCDAFALQRGAPTPMELPTKGRGYRTKGTTLELFNHANGEVIFTLKMSEGTGQHFWGEEIRGGFVHVQQRAEVIIDAWARLRDLEAIKKGELIDQLVPSSTAVQGAQLAFDKPPRLVRASREIPVRAKRDAKEPPIGAIEVGAEVYVMETVAGWTNVLPKHLGVTAPDDGGFWIPSSEVPKE